MYMKNYHYNKEHYLAYGKGVYDRKNPNVYFQSDNQNADLYINLPDNLKKAVDFILNGNAVFKVNGNEFPGNGQNLNQRIYDYYKQNFNNVVNVDDIGDVILDKRSIKDSIYHGVSSDKINAFAAVPYVLMNGIKAHTVENYNGKNETRYLFTAPIELNGKEYFCEVIVKKGPDKQAFYLHEVELIQKLSDVFSTAQHGTSDNSKSIMAGLIKKFNTYYQDDYYNNDDYSDFDEFDEFDDTEHLTEKTDLTNINKNA